MGLTSALYRLARLSADARAVRSPASAARRIQNKVVGRLLLAKPTCSIKTTNG